MHFVALFPRPGLKAPIYLLASWKVCPINRLAAVFPGTTCLVSLIVWPRRILANGKLFCELKRSLYSKIRVQAFS